MTIKIEDTPDNIAELLELLSYSMPFTGGKTKLDISPGLFQTSVEVYFPSTQKHSTIPDLQTTQEGLTYEEFIQKLRMQYNVNEDHSIVTISTNLSPKQKHEFFERLPSFINIHDAIDLFGKHGIYLEEYLVNYVCDDHEEGYDINNHVFRPRDLAGILARRNKVNRVAPELTYGLILKDVQELEQSKGQ